MTAITKEFLSGSTNGQTILVTVTGTFATMVNPGTLIHTATVAGTQMDEVWLWATNVSGTQIDLAVQWGGTTNPASLLPVGIPAGQGLTLVIPGLTINNGLAVRAFASTVSGISIMGYVNRIDTAG